MGICQDVVGFFHYRIPVIVSLVGFQHNGILLAVGNSEPENSELETLPEEYVMPAEEDQDYDE